VEEGNGSIEETSRFVGLNIHPLWRDGKNIPLEEHEAEVEEEEEEEKEEKNEAREGEEREEAPRLRGRLSP